MALRKLLEQHVASDWDGLTQPLLDICNRFPLEGDIATLRLFWQKASLISEAITKRRAMIVKGSKHASPLFFRLVFSEILKERRPSARLSDAEGCPVVYIDDVDSCGIAGQIDQILGTPTETGIEFLLSTKTLANFSDDDATRILTEVGGLAVFAVSDMDAMMIKPHYDSYFETKSTSSLSGLAPMIYHYLPKTPGARPKRLLAPFFAETRITEVEWSIVESMRNGWIFNL